MDTTIRPVTIDAQHAITAWIQAFTDLYLAINDLGLGDDWKQTPIYGSVTSQKEKVFASLTRKGTIINNSREVVFNPSAPQWKRALKSDQDSMLLAYAIACLIEVSHAGNDKKTRDAEGKKYTADFTNLLKRNGIVVLTRNGKVESSEKLEKRVPEFASQLETLRDAINVVTPERKTADPDKQRVRVYCQGDCDLFQNVTMTRKNFTAWQSSECGKCPNHNVRISLSVVGRNIAGISIR